MTVFGFFIFISVCTIALENLHEGHRGTVKMKNLSRSYVCWLGIDRQIEDLTKTFSRFHSMHKMHPHRHPYTSGSGHLHHGKEWLYWVIHELHVFNCCGRPRSCQWNPPLQKRLFLFWGVSSPETAYLIKLSDNGLQYIKGEFRLFMKKNGIKHFVSTIPPSNEWISWTVFPNLQKSPLKLWKKRTFLFSTR